MTKRNKEEESKELQKNENNLKVRGFVNVEGLLPVPTNNSFMTLWANFFFEAC